ncbi:hypothetical protein CEQ90_14295 [Lewinellaceae bacterium SD302]|nr:hypothetical protein CEQ90_14295 [Lewinellaceae bacterium SD302]
MKIRQIFNLLFLVLAFGLAFLLYKSIEEPIAFADFREDRETVVETKLETIRKAQEMYRDITGAFAPTFDTLSEVLTNESFALVRVIGDPDDPNFTGEITYDTTYRSAIDSVRSLGIDLQDLPYVPFTDNKVKFDIDAKEVEYQSTNVPVVQVGTQRKNFMGDYADARFAQYDRKYNPNAVIKFGDLNKPNLSGNWE